MSNTVRRWKRIVTEAGITYARITNLRGTFCMRSVRAGIDPKTVQALAGNSDIMTTLRYYTAASTTRTNRDAIEAMAAAG